MSIKFFFFDNTKHCWYLSKGFIEHVVQGPVVCARVDGDHLYYSTATNLFCLSLSKTLTPSSSITAVSEGDRTRPESVVCLNVCRVIALTEPFISPAGSVVSSLNETWGIENVWFILLTKTQWSVTDWLIWDDMWNGQRSMCLFLPVSNSEQMSHLVRVHGTNQKW